MKILTRAKLRHYFGLLLLVAAFYYTHNYVEEYKGITYAAIILTFLYLIVKNRLDTNKFKRRLTKSKLYKR